MPAVTPSQAATTGLDNWSVIRFIDTSLGSLIRYLYLRRGANMPRAALSQNAIKAAVLRLNATSFARVAPFCAGKFN